MVMIMVNDNGQDNGNDNGQWLYSNDIGQW